MHFATKDFVTDDAAANDARLNGSEIIACVKLPPDGPPSERYLGILRTIGTTTVTAGKINAFLTADPTDWKAYANGI